MSLFLKSIASNWEIFLNGVSIEKEIHYGEKGEIIPKRGKGLHVLIPSNLLQKGQNILGFHIIADPSIYGAGFYYGKPYTVGPTKDFAFLSFTVFFDFPILLFILLLLPYGFICLFASQGIIACIFFSRCLLFLLRFIMP